MRRAPFGLAFVLLFAITALAGPWLAPYSPDVIDLRHQYEAPSAAHPLGTGDNGVDIASVLLHGARLAGVIAISVVAISLAIGTLLGTLAAFRGGATDYVVMGVADLVQAFPAIVLNIAILALVARPGVDHVIAALVANGWVLYARVARAQALSLREREFIQAARALGVPPWAIMVKHLVPNLAGAMVIQATGGLGAAVLAESTLSFLGLGPGQAVSWGALLDQGSAVLLRFPHVALFAGAAIGISVLGFNLTGDWLRDRLDPKHQHH